jgi:hypothetical protein
MKSVVYPLLDFEAVGPPPGPDNRIPMPMDPDKADEIFKSMEYPEKVYQITVKATKENDIGSYYYRYPNDNRFSTKVVGSKKTKGYNSRSRMNTMSHDFWLKSNPVELLPDTYIGNMIPANRVVVILPVIDRLKKDPDQKWSIFCKTYSFMPGESRGALNMIDLAMFPLQDTNTWLITESNRINVKLNELKRMMKFDIEKDLKKNNTSEYILQVDLSPSLNRLFVDIIAKVPMVVYYKDRPHTVNSPDRTKRIALKTLDCSGWKWKITAEGKTVAELKGPDIKKFNIPDKHSFPWMLRHELIGRQFKFAKGELYLALKSFFKKYGTDKQCQLTVSLPLYLGVETEASKKRRQAVYSTRKTFKDMRTIPLPDKEFKPVKKCTITSDPITVTYAQITEAKKALIKDLKEELNLPPKEYIEKVREKREKILYRKK